MQSPTQLGSTNGVRHDASRAEDEQNKLLPKVQEQDSLQADSEKGLVKLSSVWTITCTYMELSFSIEGSICVCLRVKGVVLQVPCNVPFCR